MLVVDSCFIIELRCYPREKENRNPVFEDQRMINHILLDMVMLENQIPLFVMQKLVQLIYTNNDDAVACLKGQVLNLFNSEWLTVDHKSTRKMKNQSDRISQEPSESVRSTEERLEKAKWVISIEEKLNEARRYVAGRSWEKWCIYQVTGSLTDVQKGAKAYAPQTVSLGPHHLRSEQVQDMQFHKWVSLHQILERTSQNISLYLDAIKQEEERARDCYQQKFKDLSSNEFVEMMVLDTCFIIELFRCYPSKIQNGNPVFSHQRIINNILLDMVKLENQIPLFVIHKVVRLIYNSSDPVEHLKGQVLNLFNSEWLTGIPITEKEFSEIKSSLNQEQCFHILDAFRQILLYAGHQQVATHEPRSPRSVFDKLVPGCVKQWLEARTSPDKKSKHEQVIYRVTDLRRGGVKFKKRKSHCFWDIRFENGVLEIPTIWIQDSTMAILLNVATFENCNQKISDAVIASYVVFMECLIKSSEDVSHLHHCGIIQHVLGHDAEVVDMFKSISKEVIVDAHGGHFAELSQRVNAYYSRRRNRWRASLLQKYLNNPWVIISLVVAFTLLILTAIQSFYSVYSYYRPNS